MIRRNTILTFAAAILFILFMFKSETVKAASVEALTDCAVKVIPVIFPFTVLSGVAVGIFSRLESPKFPRIFVYLLGALCGFPIGAVCTAGLYKSGVLSKDDAEILAGICNNTGPAFVIGVVGTELIKSKTAGILIYVIQIMSSLICVSIFMKNRHMKPIGRTAAVISGEGNLITRAVSDGALTSLKICGYIVFFKVITRTAIPSFLPPGIKAILCSFLECTAGSSLAGTVGGACGFVIASFAVSFSGLSVLLQSADVMEDSGLSVRYTALEKFVQGVISAVISFLFVILFPGLCNCT